MSKLASMTISPNPFGLTRYRQAQDLQRRWALQRVGRTGEGTGPVVEVSAVSKSFVALLDGEDAAILRFETRLLGALFGVVTVRIDVPENAGVSLVARLGVDGMNYPPLSLVAPSSSTGKVLDRLLRFSLGRLSHDPSPFCSSTMVSTNRFTTVEVRSYASVTHALPKWLERH